MCEISFKSNYDEISFKSNYDKINKACQEINNMEDLSRVEKVEKMYELLGIEAPTEINPFLEVVFVVRCKDCIHRPYIDGEFENGFSIEFPDNLCPCQCDDGWYNWMPDDDWYCANGERSPQNG